MSLPKRPSNPTTSPRASIANTLGSLIKTSVSDQKTNEEFKKLVVKLADIVEQTITPDGIRFPNGTFQSIGLDPNRPAATRMSTADQKRSQRVEDIISLFLSF